MVSQIAKRLDLLLISVTVGVTALFMLGSGVYTIITEREFLLKQIDIEGNALATATAIFSTEPLLINDYPVLETYAANIVRREYHVGSLEIFRSDGKSVVQNISSHSEEAIEQDKIRYYQTEIYPHKDSDKSIGYVSIGILTQPFYTVLRKRIVTVSTQILLSFLALIAVLFLVIKRTVATPLIQLDRVVTALGEGNLNSPIELKSQNELGHLAHTIDAMRINLNRLYTQLTESNANLIVSEQRYRDLAENLEHRVQEQVETIELTQKQLYQSEKMASIGQLAAGMAHEINNPISFVQSNSVSLIEYVESISTYIAALEKSTVEVRTKNLKSELDIPFILEDISDLVESNLEGVERVQEIIQNLRKFSTVDEHLSQNRTTIEENIATSLAVISSDMKDRVTIEKKFRQTTIIRCNSALLNQALLNILMNAFQAVIAGENEGHITISTKEDSDLVYCEISDNGIGIPDSIQERVFTPFFTTKIVGTGKGLGLHLSYDIIVNKLNGIISFTSEESRGTTFIIGIPKRY